MLRVKQVITQKWVDKLLVSGVIIERQLTNNTTLKTKLVSFENAIEFIKLIPPIEQKQTKLKFIDMICRYLEGDISLLLKDDHTPDELSAAECRGEIPKRKHNDDLMKEAKKHVSRDADLAFITNAATSLKNICGGQLDDDAKEALKSKMFKLLERDF